MTSGAALWLSLLAVVAGAALSLGLAPTDAPVDNRPLEVQGEGYVTSETCQACHPREYGTWRASYHRSMTQVATPASIVAPFDGAPLSVYGETYRLVRRGDEHWMIQDGAGANGTRRERRIVMTTGSHHFQAYWLETGERRKISLFPLAYRIAERAWLPFDAIFLSPPEPNYSLVANSAGLWNAVCAECHSTAHRPRLQRPGGMDTFVGEFGIACEACHGPAERHVRVNRDPTRRYGLYRTDDGDSTIVQPARLAHDRSAEVCGQCHSVHGRVAESAGVAQLGVKDYLDHVSTYRPGDVLAEHQTLLLEDGPQTLSSDLHTHFWADGTVRVNGREYNSLLRSPCFQRGEMSCLSCHAMHQAADDGRPREAWADDQLKPRMAGSAACVSCHEPYRDPATVAAHTHHAPTSSGSDCLNCHMPYTAWGLQKATRSHEIASPTVVESLETGRPNACNLCHLDRTLAWTAGHLDLWYGIASPPLDEQWRSFSAAVLWLLTGDAGQRGLLAWALGWPAAREASGDAWIPPYLGIALQDPYPTVRFTALRSLRQIDGFEAFDADPMAPEEEHGAIMDRLMRTFIARGGTPERADAALLLMTPAGAWRQEVVQDLLAQRNHRVVRLME